MNCPRDNQELVKQEYGEVAFEACPHCGGIWMIGEEFEDALGDGESLFTPDASFGSKRSHEPVNCPMGSDHELVQQTFYGIQIDTCPKHRAIWFDGGELSRLLQTWRQATDAGNFDPKEIAKMLFSQFEDKPTVFDKICETFARLCVGICKSQMRGHCRHCDHDVW